MKRVFPLFLLFLLGSCSSYIDSWHRKMDKDSNVRRPVSRGGRNNQFDFYRQAGNQPAGKPPAGVVSTNSKRSHMPTTKRNYQPEEQVKKRFRATDLTDSGPAASLWTGKGKDSFLLTSDVQKKSGDIVLINVMGKLKDEITAELKRAFPARRPLKKKKEDEEEKKEGEESEPAAKPVAAAAGADRPSATNTVHDKISSVVIEEINDDHLLLSGRKSLLFNNRKHLIELQALVNRRNVSNMDEVNSVDILESSITVLR